MTLTLSTLAPLVASLPLQLGGGNFLWLAIVFFVIAIIAAAVGFRGAAGVSSSAAKLFVVVFLVLAVISFVL